ncbi:phosphatidylserine decarboxylase related protein [Desulfarculus baarsii DSM 2075]|uniref:Phosphatidylserine decarboxylase proenzyme n=1 Tax=Desulfarculus baarsii (strain ATCC 33931 / DSM 2075 / LMG 7858 / VKM B-1802 / 2st14) TaxID=644282 RepID=E1QEY7_DESB2|nr:phosphatidylserine decarboxylase family protein [Desulfarculus baarsii]ADK84123.1 phosphatidylserine decarboxylase related protein [Desulfarculus baarsii DSM 2075]
MVRIDKFPLAAPGWPYYLGAALLAAAATAWGPWWLAAPLWGLCAFVVFFFRDPARQGQSAANQLLSPADGTVVYVGPASHPSLGDQPLTMISIFMSLFNVHVNRAPLSGRVLSMRHIAGGFAMANLERASQANERLEVVFEAEGGQRVLVAQVAGMVARRIECELAPEQNVQKGARYGMIRFGSRLDVYLPQEAAVLVAKGQKARAGLTVIGEL